LTGRKAIDIIPFSTLKREKERRNRGDSRGFISLFV